MILDLVWWSGPSVLVLFLLLLLQAGEGRPLSRHVPGIGGDPGAEGVPGQSQRWSSAPPEGVHPRR